jgi:hypothetical protein
MKDEALKLALEALEKSVATCFDRYAHEQVMSRPEHFINQAITAIKQALAAQPAPVQPVAWTLLLVGAHNGLVGKAGEKFLGHPEHYQRVDVYTAPPAAQRQWVGLADEEIFSVLDNLQRKYNGPPTEDSRVVFALAIEAKLKEKNT